jgi:hypothetical protein
MTYSVVNEKINVLAVFKNGTIFPYIFSWQNKKRKIEKVNLRYQERNGSFINYYFAIESNGFIGKLKYDSNSMIWTLEEVWVE